MLSRISRQLAILLTAVAVFVVGTTCTPLGCLLSGQMVQGQTKMNCCAVDGGHSRSTPLQSSGAPKPGSCPVGVQPMLAGSTISKTAAYEPIVPAAVPLSCSPLTTTAFLSD